MSKQENEDSRTGCGCAVIIFIVLAVAGVIEPSTLLMVILALIILALI